MDHGSCGGGRSSSRLRDRLARMFRPGTLLRSTCNTTASTCSSSSTAVPAGGAGSSSRALLAAVASRDSRVEDAFVSSSRRDYVVARTESFSTSVDRLRRRVAVVAPALPSRFSIGERVVDKEMERIDKQTTTAKLKLLSNDPYGFSSSDDDTTNAAVFSSDADEDLAGGRVDGAHKKLAAETFFSSSRSFSSDSSEFYATKKKKKKATTNRINKSPAAAAPPNKYNKPPLPPSAAGTRRTSWKTKEQQRPRHHRRRAASSSCDTCGVRDGFRPVVVSAAEEHLRKGFAVVKRSPDPYADFRSSMVEMIVGRQLFGERELERLLRSYLTLNAPRHHPVILQAFSDIWVVLHGG